MRSGLVRLCRLLLARFPTLRLGADMFTASRFHLVSGPVTAYRLATLKREPAPGTRGARRVRLRPLGGQRVLLRPRTSDHDVVLDTFVGHYHLPPPKLVPQTVLDLGANIGLTMAHYAVLFPGASIMGVELDADNVALCEQNVRPYRNRCVVAHGAVWPTETVVTYRRRPGNELGFTVGTDNGDEQVAVRTLTIDSLLEQAGWTWVDFVKMDIEGAEQMVLRDAGRWAASIGCISVEVHPPYSVDECERDLQAAGFRTTRHPRHWAAVVGDRTGTAVLH